MTSEKIMGEQINQTIVSVGRGEEQPKDKERAQTVAKTKPSQISQPMPKQQAVLTEGRR